MLVKFVNTLYNCLFPFAEKRISTSVVLKGQQRKCILLKCQTWLEFTFKSSSHQHNIYLERSKWTPLSHPSHMCGSTDADLSRSHVWGGGGAVVYLVCLNIQEHCGDPLFLWHHYDSMNSMQSENREETEFSLWRQRLGSQRGWRETLSYISVVFTCYAIQVQWRTETSEVTPLLTALPTNGKVLELSFHKKSAKKKPQQL